jgi:hypothetical protein
VKKGGLARNFHECLQSRQINRSTIGFEDFEYSKRERKENSPAWAGEFLSKGGPRLGDRSVPDSTSRRPFKSNRVLAGGSGAAAETF